ncbi:MAG: GGDEF domain-containing protein, partial [Acidimicrobiales bacterium]
AVLGIITVNLVTLLRQSSEVDALTKLANRRAWEHRSEEEFERTKRSGGSLSMVIIDVDDFKEVNDRDGHSAGDHLLRALADGWSREIRGGGDFLARIGGDEFAYLAPGADVQRITLVIERLRQSMPEGVSCSFGASSWRGISTLADLERSADEAMYRAKRERKMNKPDLAASGD